MQHSIPITIARSNSGNELSLVLKTGAPKYKDNPYSEPTAITTSQPGGIPYLKVSLFPGKIGIDFANEVDAVFKDKFASPALSIYEMQLIPALHRCSLTEKKFARGVKKAVPQAAYLIDARCCDTLADRQWKETIQSP